MGAERQTPGTAAGLKTGQARGFKQRRRAPCSSRRGLGPRPYDHRQLSSGNPLDGPGGGSAPGTAPAAGHFRDLRLARARAEEPLGPPALVTTQGTPHVPCFKLLKSWQFVTAAIENKHLERLNSFLISTKWGQRKENATGHVGGRLRAVVPSAGLGLTAPGSSWLRQQRNVSSEEMRTSSR